MHFRNVSDNILLPKENYRQLVFTLNLCNLLGRHCSLYGDGGRHIHTQIRIECEIKNIYKRISGFYVLVFIQGSACSLYEWFPWKAGKLLSISQLVTVQLKESTANGFRRCFQTSFVDQINPSNIRICHLVTLSKGNTFAY